MNTLIPVILLLVVAGLLWACNGPRSPAATETVDTTRAATPALSSAVVFTRSGGIAGFDDRLNISPDGTLEISSSGNMSERKLSAAELDTLIGLLAAAKSVAEDSGSSSEGYDLITYTLVYEGVTVTANDLTESEELRQAVEFLAGLLQT